MFSFLFTTFIGKLICIFFISMVPFIELRGSIVYAALAGVDLIWAFPVAIIGNMLPVPFIILFIKKIFAWIRRIFPKLNSFVDRLEEKGKSKKDQIEKGAFWGLFLFVGIPLPGTGAWTGSLIAAMLDMKMKKAVPSIVLGVISAGIIMAILSYFLPGLFF